MDTRWKRFSYSIFGKSLLVILMSICLGGCFLSSAFLMQYGYESPGKGSYFETKAFFNNMQDYCTSAIELATVYKDEANIKEGNTISDETVNEWKKQLEEQFSYAAPPEEISEVAVNKDEEINRQLLSNRLEHIYSDLSSYRYDYDKVYNSPNFIFIVTNTQTGEVVSNIKDSIYLSKEAKEWFINDCRYHHITASQQNLDYSSLKVDGDFYSFRRIDELLLNKPYTFAGAVKDPLEKGDSFYEDYMNYQIAVKYSTRMMILLVVSFLVGLIAFITLLMVLGRKEKDGPVRTFWLDKIPFEIQAVISAFLIFLSIAGAKYFIETYKDDVFLNLMEMKDAILVLYLITLADALVTLTFVCSITRSIKNKSLSRYSITNHIFTFIKKIVSKAAEFLFGMARLPVTVTLLMIAYIIMNMILSLMASREPAGGFLLLLFNAAALFLLLRMALKFKQVCSETEIIAKGEFSHHLQIAQLPHFLRPLAAAINNIKQGLAHSINAAVKSERMRTELITNVSHDLKTPLTSIINYVGLLKKEEVENEKAASYINVLDEKSQRLKQLIEDLMEATKASTGNIAVSPSDVDLYQLVQQWLGEYDDKLQDAELEIKLSSQEEMPLVRADAKHAWRIVENLLGNAVKYSMKNSRVYVTIEEKGSYGILTVKNMSRQPLNMTPDELMGRFVRGDASRTTEGSGLGLSIAQSLAILQQGDLSITIDGDLFKAVVKLPLSKTLQPNH